ncbi:multidrug effflux MFS transporter [uncultured Tateyamaria sp.]|uniref:multidrug effflux MFS transporter n=1 Tax=uncultured Tateyamaria sp. TaxID=455651 RepID=UPI00262012DE|nr:multidrug effflux MFS transporter [uncultured Tateyamaria sp.]
MPSGRRSRNLYQRKLAATTSTIFLLAGIAAVGQFASNIYTPSLPSVALDLGVSQGASQATLAVFLGAFAITQLVVGPLSDQFGRKPILLIGLAVFLVGTMLCSTAVDFSDLLFGRIVQGSGSAAGIVVSRAMTRDSFEGVELARVLAAVTIAFALVPGFTPLIGGFVEQMLGWRATFWITGALGLLLALIVIRTLPETLASHRRVSPLMEVAEYGAILRDPVFGPNALAVACAFASMSAFFSGAPAVLIGTLGVSPIEFGLYPPVAVSGFVIGGVITRRMAARVAARAMSVLGARIMLAGAVLLFLPPAFGLLNKFLINGAMVVHVTGLGILLPASIAAALQRFPKKAGAAAALQGFLQMSGGALGAASAAALMSALAELSFPTVMLLAATLAWLTASRLVPEP